MLRRNLIIFFIYIAGVQGLHNVTLEITPDVVERGQEVTLRCHYVLDEPHLYSLKWYRGKHEFYRFSPKENPTTKTFNITGIEVDMERSNESQVTIRNVDFSLSGNVTCEVTADAPTFSTESATKKLIIVVLPNTKPTITSERRRYTLGDMLKANCSLPPSRPPVEFSFTLNNLPILQTSTKSPNQDAIFFDRNATFQHDESEWQWIQTNLTLQPYHYTNGQLYLRCIAQIPGIFKATTEMQLNAWEPVPERGPKLDPQVPDGDIDLSSIRGAAVTVEPLEWDQRFSLLELCPLLVDGACVPYLFTSDDGDTLHLMGFFTMMIFSMIHLLCR